MQADDGGERRQFFHSSNSPISLVVIALIVVALIAATNVSLGYLSRQRKQLDQLASANQSLSSALDHTRAELRALTERLDQPPPAVRSKTPVSRAVASPDRKATRVAPIDPRVKQLQTQVAEQQKQLDSSRDDLNRTREDLEGKVNSTRDELSGSIALTHDQVVDLQKRGEREYFEFTIGKAKDFRRVGPFSISLRKINFKRKSYDLAMIVDDIQLQKKNVNLYEPVWIRVGTQPQPAELVVNQITKDQIQGYISEPRYKQSAVNEKSLSVTPQ
jgi:uncharacterized coiled-coil protein SlyX